MKKRFYVFIAEDNEYDIFFLKRIFKTKIQKYDVIIKETVKESILFFQNNTGPKNLPNLILLDIRLDDGSGFELLKYVKKNNLLKDLPTIVMSSSDRKEDVENAIKLGADKYIEKIRTYKELKEKLPLIVDYWATNLINDYRNTKNNCSRR